VRVQTQLIVSMSHTCVHILLPAPMSCRGYHTYHNLHIFQAYSKCTTEKEAIALLENIVVSESLRFVISE